MDKKNLETLKNKLPLTPGILRKEEYLNSAVLIPLVYKDGEYHFLFEKRSEKIRQGGEICFPGGEFDPSIDKNFEETAIRETIEEIGVSKINISVIGILDTLIGPTGVTVDSFIGTINIDDIMNLQFDKNEVEKIFLLPVSFFTQNEPENYFVRMEIHPSEIDKNGDKIDILPVKELQLPDRYSKPWRGKRHKIYVYKTKEGVIWGITAVLIREIVKRLK
jgi:8-oxo-dGTP pyrophosphatase MutT (NUDIX family)